MNARTTGSSPADTKMNRNACRTILTINGGSSSIKFALFEAGEPLRRIFDATIARIGLPEAVMRVNGADAAE